MCGSAFAGETIYVRSTAALAEVIPDPPFVLDETIKTKLKTNLPTHPVYGVKYITVYMARVILGVEKGEAQQVIDALIEDGTIKLLSERYEELYPSEETP